MPNERFIKANDPALQYMGRIDWEDAENPIWVYPCTSVRVHFTGNSIKADITNFRNCWDNFLGYLIDGTEYKLKLSHSGREVYTLAQNLEDTSHDLLLFKRQDACHMLQFHGLIVGEDSVIDAPVALPSRRMEVYGDSVSAGEVSEAIAYCGMADPPHNGEFSNSYYSYAWCTARLLNAQLHDIAQGGAALLAETGYFHAPDYQGMEQIYNKIQYNDQIMPDKPWDFSKYTPHVVVVAIGQNDNHPDDYMQRDPVCEKVQHWKAHYEAFIRNLRHQYPNAYIILSTTILDHHPGWDDAIEEVCTKIADRKVRHFLYSNNGCGTCGHIRVPEAEQMAKELSAYIDSLPGVWED